MSACLSLMAAASIFSSADNVIPIPEWTLIAMKLEVDTVNLPTFVPKQGLKIVVTADKATSLYTAAFDDESRIDPHISKLEDGIKSLFLQAFK